MATPERGLVKGPRPDVANCQVITVSEHKVHSICTL